MGLREPVIPLKNDRPIFVGYLSRRPSAVSLESCGPLVLLLGT